VRTALVFAAFALVVVIFFGDVIVGPKVLIDANPGIYDPWRNYASPEDLANKTQQTDSFLEHLPIRAYLTESLRTGRFPLWNPYICGGMPFFADPQTRAAYPLAWLLMSADPARALGYDIAIHVLLAMVGMYLFLKSLRLATWGAILGACSYAFSSFFYVRYGHQSVLAAGAWVPFFFYGFELAAARGKLGTLALAAFLALGYLSGFPQVFLLGVVAVIVYGFYLAVDRPAEERRGAIVKTAGIFAVSGLLSMLVVSAQLLAFLEYYRNSVGLHYDFAHVKEVLLAPPAVLLRTIFPAVLGQPVNGTDWSGLIRGAVHPYNPEFAVYGGVGSLITALVAILGLRGSARVRILAIILGLSVLVAVEQHFARLGYALLPMFRASRVSRVAAVSCFTFSALAAFGYSSIWMGVDARLRRRIALAAGSVAAVALVSLVVFWISGDSIILGLAEKARSLPDDFWSPTQVATRSGKIREWARTGLSEWGSYEQRTLATGTLLALGTGLLLGAWSLVSAGRSRLRLALAVCFVVVVGFDVFLTARTYRISQSPASVAETDGIRTLKHLLGGEGAWRIKTFRAASGDRTALPPNTNQVYGVPSIYGSIRSDTRALDTYRAAYTGLKQTVSDEERGPRTLGPGVSWLTNRLDDLISVRYVLAERGQARYAASSVLRSIPAADATPARGRLLSVGDGARLALCQRAGDTYRFEAILLPVDLLSFSLGFNAAGGTPGDSVFFSLVLENESGRLEYRRGFVLTSDAGRWHEAGMDISGLKGRLTQITAALSARASSGTAVEGGWGDFELTTAECPVARGPRGYEIALPAAGRCFSLSLSTSGRELPLDIVADGGSRTRRVFAFPSHMKSRRVRIDLDSPAQTRLTVTSDSTFAVEGCRQIPREWGTDLDCGLIYDGDMCIYENSRAVVKGVCLDAGRVGKSSRAGRPVLALASLGDAGSAECGRSRLVAYEPEKVTLRVSTDRRSVLVLQDMMYPGWRASVDGKAADILETDLGVRAIELDRGDHEVTMTFRPAGLRAGIVLAVLGCLLATVYAVGPRRLYGCLPRSCRGRG
jgi:hypothetical protein